MSFDYTSIASTSAQAGWWSPAASGLSAPHGDFELLRQAKQSGGFHKLSDNWIAEVLGAATRVGIGLRTGGAWEWLFPLRALSRGALICWPAELIKLDGWLQMRPQPSATRIVLRGIFSAAPSDLQVVCFEWKPWVWQAKHFTAKTVAGLLPGVRAIVDKFGKQSLQHAGCRCAWWSLSRSTVADLAALFKIPFESGASLADLLWALAKDTLKLDDEHTLDTLYSRVARDSSDSEVASELLQLDEALEVVDHLDCRKVHDAQKEVKSGRERKEAFKADYTARAAKLRPPAHPAKKRKKDASASSSSCSRLRWPEAHHITQPEARALIPPASSIWRSLTRGECCGHMQGHTRVSCAFHRYGGSHDSLRACLQKLWTQYAGKMGMPVSECPIEGLF